ncbi:MAG: ph-response sensor protein [Peltula sp. TS41687]|nr:MAG: ph-response sensor protein [Peltula sp. TS41687]
MAQTSLSLGHPSPASTPSSPASASSSITRNLLARVRSPFSSSKTRRALSDFYIQPEEPHRTYSPGDLVRGVVILKVSKPIRITHLVVCLHGSVQVFRNGLLERWTNSSPKMAKRPTEQQVDGFKWLFQDEVVLSGEGRLEVGIYEFHFELEFPKKDLPSSIDFGRGLISYNITSTLTRPTTVNPTINCDHQLRFNETIDIGLIDIPKPRLITLEPINRRSKTKVSIERESSSTKKPSESNNSATPSSLVQVARIRTEREVESRHSSAPSETGTESTVSGSAGSIQQGSVSSLPRQSQERPGKPKKTITATVELSHGGCLPGDLLSLKITIDHNKPIKSLQGVIVTIYRQGRLEFDHECGCGSSSCKECSSRREKNADKKRKSKATGISSCSAGSSITYRKDLSQVCSPLIVDPQTLTTVIRASIRVPEDIFPTISSVPGSLISFRYHVEIVLDVHGKLAGQDRFLSNLKVQTNPSIDGRAGIAPPVNNVGRAGGLQSHWDGSLIDTVRLRHEKTVVACLFEVVVGTMNSGRTYSRRIETKGAHGQSRSVEEVTVLDTTDMRYTDPDQPDAREINESHGHNHPAHDDLQGPITIPIPPPEVAEELDEKTRLRQAEERLLPSRPPQPEVAMRQESVMPGPSAPLLCGDDQRCAISTNWSATQHFEPSAPPTDSIMQGTVGNTTPSDEQGNGLEFDASAQNPNTTPAATEDKQELERQRLLAEASAPDDHPADVYVEEEEDTGIVGPSAISIPVTPSAPVLAREEEYGHLRQFNHNELSFGHDFHSAEGLPKYER